MATTQKRITVSFTKEDIKQLKFLCEKFEETQTAVIKRAIIALYAAEKIESEASKN